MNKGYGLIAGLAAFFILLLAPIDPSIMPEAARITAAVTAMMVIFWITQPIPIEATSLIPLVAFPVLGILSPSQVGVSYASPRKRSTYTCPSPTGSAFTSSRPNSRT